MCAVDVRNRYESAAGKFADAIACDIEHFRELPTYLEQLDALKDRKVLMYCTGGIRCEKASALFRSRGFTNVFQLHGGIVTYQEQFGNEHWLGECFVFDQRMTVRVDDALVPIGCCAHTGRPTNRFANCLHDPCHVLFLLAEETERENADTRLCPECLARGLTSATADYKGSPARAALNDCEMTAGPIGRPACHPWADSPACQAGRGLTTAALLTFTASACRSFGVPGRRLLALGFALADVDHVRFALRPLVRLGRKFLHLETRARKVLHKLRLRHG